MSNDIVNPKMTFENELRFTPYAWAKMLYMRDHGDTEVGGYGVTGTEDPLLVTDFRLIKSDCTGASFDMDPDDGVEFMETMLDAGLMPWQYSNILIHTHPGNSPSPSGTDEKNFEAAFSHPNWAIMFIIAEGGAAYCRLKINVGPGSVKEIKVVVDWKTAFNGTNEEEWKKEYDAKVKAVHFRMTGKEGVASKGAGCFPEDIFGLDDPLWYDDKEDRWIGFSHAQQTELDNQAMGVGDGYSSIDDIDCHWDSNGDVVYWDEDSELWYYYDPIQELWCVENVEDEVTGDDYTDIPVPNEHWATQVVLWANKYADERHLALEETS